MEKEMIIQTGPGHRGLKDRQGGRVGGSVAPARVPQPPEVVDAGFSFAVGCPVPASSK